MHFTLKKDFTMKQLQKFLVNIYLAKKLAKVIVPTLVALL
jgi:hypothetical protein